VSLFAHTQAYFWSIKIYALLLRFRTQRLTQSYSLFDPLQEVA